LRQRKLKTKTGRDIKPARTTMNNLKPFSLAIRDGRKLVWLNDQGKKTTRANSFYKCFWAKSATDAALECERRANCYQVIHGKRIIRVEVERLQIGEAYKPTTNTKGRDTTGPKGTR
jgi:hypothetical protein